MRSPVDELLEQVKRAGVRLELDGDQVTIKGPRPAIAELLPVLKAHKPALVVVLTEAESWRQRLDCWLRFQAAADKILSQPLGFGREAALREYEREKVDKYGPNQGAAMGREMTGWVKFRSEFPR